MILGSPARGEAGANSDLDLLVVEPEVEDVGREAVRLMRELRDLRVPAEVIEVSDRYVEDWREVRGKPRARGPVGGSLAHRLMADQRDLARELLARAQDDERAARALLPAGEVSDAIVGFHAQQAVEKALKAALASAGAESPSLTTWVY